MKTKNTKFREKEHEILKNIGENIKLARLRRRLTAEQVSERANISRSTLWHIEKGSEHISIGAILKVVSVLGLEEGLLEIAKDDILGRKLQDINMVIKKRGMKNKI
ncbi:MAG: helix-turn-helix transcriptional regulator [Candidatus Marinimicrobia bacterium]|nr:helix-turn-helix transcriptional regulator [Candidatus Neomarinimicrobiota bacterium]